MSSASARELTTKKMKKHHDDGNNDDLLEQQEISVERLLEIAKLVVPTPRADRPINDVSPYSCFRSVTKLDLPNCGLSSLPKTLPDALPNLSILFLSNNCFSQVPAVVGDFPELQMMAFRGNRMTSIHPEALQPQLRWLILTDNHLSSLPETIGRCRSLQKCMLSGNRLTSLPESIAQCRKLELIRLASNSLTEPPYQLLRLPNLCWAGLSDNPFLSSLRKQHSAQLPVLTDVDESAGTVLGQGAGGVTRKATWGGKPVAVKTFKEGSITSDGWPEEERNIACTVSELNCPTLGVKVYGTTPKDNALVMEYLDEHEALADPPSLETCSRDVIPEHRSLTREQAEKLLSGMLDALVHLHEAGICHGDFYGHNILVSKSDPSNARLTDYGAAYHYDPTSEYGKLLQKIELRAFAVLVDEVASIVNCKRTEMVLTKYLSATCREEEAKIDHVQSWWKDEQPLSLSNL